MAFLSVIVPIYGVEKYLRQCVESIVTQNYQDIEIILVDDGSKDSCPAICDEYANMYSVIRVLHKTNGGLVSARKAGVEAATGQYVAFVDGDDYVDHNMYEKICAIARSTNSDIVVTGFKFMYPERMLEWNDALQSGLYTKSDLETKVYPIMMCHDNTLERKMAPAVWNKLFKRELLERVLFGVPETIKDGEDAAITYPCMLLAEKVFFSLEEHAYNYRILSESMSHHYDADWYKSASDYCRWMEESIAGFYPNMKNSVSLEKYRMFYRYIYREFEKYLSQGINEYCERLQIIDKSGVGASRHEVKVSCLDIPIHDKIICSLLNDRKYKLAYRLMRLIRMTSNLIRKECTNS